MRFLPLWRRYKPGPYSPGNRAIAVLAAVLALLTLTTGAIWGQSHPQVSAPLQWTYSYDANGAAVADYPGNVTITGSATATGGLAGNVPCASLPALTGNVTSIAGGCATAYKSQAANTVLGNATGAPAVPTATAVIPAMLASQAADTVLGNFTGSPASPTATAVPASTGTLRYTAGTGFVADAVGQLPATVTNDDAAAGKVGEVIASVIPTASAVSLSSGVAKDITSVSLTAGDWDCHGDMQTKPAGTTTTSTFYGGISQATNTLPTNHVFTMGSAVPAGNAEAAAVPYTRISQAGTASVFLVTDTIFAVSTMSAFGSISCRRAR
jgi:hypothetical protein